MTEPCVTVALVQDRFARGDVEANLDRLLGSISRAAGAGAELLVAPELATTGYFTDPEIEELAEPLDGPTVSSLRAAAADAGIALCLGIAELGEDGRRFNSAIVIDCTGDLVAVHRKTHLWAREAERFHPGDEPLTLFDLAGFRAATLICYEVEFPELVRKVALAGADLLLVPTAVADFGTGGFFTSQVIGSRATENNIFVVYANHAGVIDGVESIGSSVVAAPLSRLRHVSGTEPDFAVVRLDRADLVAARDALPYLRDRRPELY